jgi:Ni/Co efflux regulator RcnB
MLRNFVFAVAVTLTAIPSALAQGQGDARERAACRPGRLTTKWSNRPWARTRFDRRRRERTFSVENSDGLPR